MGWTDDFGRAELTMPDYMKKGAARPRVTRRPGRGEDQAPAAVAQDEEAAFVVDEQVRFAETGEEWWRVGAVNSFYTVLVPAADPSAGFLVVDHDDAMWAPATSTTGHLWDSGTDDEQCRQLLVALQAGDAELDEDRAVPVRVLERRTSQL